MKPHPNDLDAVKVRYDFNGRTAHFWPSMAFKASKLKVGEILQLAGKEINPADFGLAVDLAKRSQVIDRALRARNGADATRIDVKEAVKSAGKE